MQPHIGKAVRMQDILHERSLMLDTTIASSIGAVPALEDLKSVLRECRVTFDGVIVNPGPMEHLSSELGGKNAAAPLIRVDWTNAYRDADFCLPVSEVKRVEISRAKDVMSLGGSAAVATFLMGFDDEFEAENVRSLSLLLREGYELSLPVIADIRPIGPKVGDVNFEDAIKLGVSFMLEAGADALIIPRCGIDALKLIAEWSTVPIIIRTEELMKKKAAGEIFGLDVKGLLFNERILEVEDYPKKIGALRRI